MVKNLVKHGNSNALVLDRASLELINIDPSQPVEISTDGRSLIISPVTDQKRRQRSQAALTAVNKRHGKTLRRLAQ